MSKDRLRAEIDAKRAKIAEMREARNHRAAQLASSATSGAASPALTSSRQDVNDLVDSLLASHTPVRPGTPLDRSISRQSRVPGVRSPDLMSSVGAGPSRPSTPAAGLTKTSDAASSPVMVDAESSASPFPRPQVDFVETHSELYELPTKPVRVMYTKSIQTSTPPAYLSSQNTEDDEDSRPQPSASVGRETEDEMRQRLLRELEDEHAALNAELAREIADIPEEERQSILGAPEFSSFLDEASKIVQRALTDNYDYIRDYTIGGDGLHDDREGQSLKAVCTFADQRWTKNRSVTDVDWSPKFPELSVASYNKNPSSINDPDGLVAVWNMHLLDRPEFVFHSQSDVLSVCFSAFHPTLIFGGTYSGQVLLWDTRAKSLPVLKTPLSAAGHTYPIYAMRMVGTQNANNLITSSTDGLVCSWLTDMLAQPQEVLPFTHTAHSKTDEVSITCLDFPDNETSTFWIGTEEGSVFQAQRYDRAGAKAGLNQDEVYKGHAGPVTGLHFHPLVGPVDFSDLFLTSSVDWTVKLWRAKAKSAPVHSFEESDDYVYDVKWHPQHPAMFGTVDGTGKFDLWNLNKDTEVPVSSVQPSSRALNKLAFDKASGRKVALGSSDGNVYIYDVGEQASPRESEWSDMQKTVSGMLAGGDTGGL